uniref:UBC core domain-containing protein n=1 Tax=Aegilops tauschii subsp. strangulata TaxID=200361 RepID=A0A453T1X4_AEGTS
VSPPRSPRLRPAPPIPSPPTHRLPIALPSSRCEGASAGIGRSLLPRRLQLDLLPGPPGASRGRRAPWSPHRAASAVVGEQSVPVECYFETRKLLSEAAHREPLELSAVIASMATNENLPPNVIRQLAKELKNLDESPPEGIEVIVNDDDFST